MLSRQSNDSTSQNGINYQVGSAAPRGTVQKNVTITKQAEATSNSLLGKNGAFNGHAVEIWADGAVFDTVLGVHLRPGTDFNPGDVQRK